VALPSEGVQTRCSVGPYTLVEEVQQMLCQRFDLPSSEVVSSSSFGLPHQSHRRCGEQTKSWVMYLRNAYTGDRFLLPSASTVLSHPLGSECVNLFFM